MEGAQYLHTADTNVNVCTSLQVEYVCSFLVGCLVTSAWKQHTFAVLYLMRQMQRDLWSTRLLRWNIWLIILHHHTGTPF